MASEMVERVAQAIVLVFECRWDACTPVQQEMARTRARTAIHAMREPTEAMARAATGVMLESGEDSVPAWQTMIDAALDDPS